MSLHNYTQLNKLSLELKTSLQSLLLTLKKEHQLLQENDIAVLSEIALQKKQLCENIEQIEQQRTMLIAESGTTLTHETIQQFVTLASQSVPSLLENWQQVEQLGKACSEQNQVNGMIVQSSRRNVESRLAILHGQPIAPDSYARNGKSAATTYSKPLAQV